MIKEIKVKGNKVADITLYSLSTCGWCQKVKFLLNSKKLEYSYIDVDLLPDKEKKEVEKIFSSYKTDFSFPKIIINKRVISGYVESEILNAINGRK